jgi:enamine deaminase RidA (YjgF/YER057c/UK114 family)
MRFGHTLRILVALAALLSSSILLGTTYYVSISTGADTNTGTSKTAAWAHIPGMATCTGKCASYNPAAGDTFVLMGCDVWGNSNFPIDWSWNGSSGSPITFGGEDQTWYNTTNCPSAWARPVFTGGGTPMGGSTVHNDFVYWSGGSGSYTTIDQIEFTGFDWTVDNAYGNNAYLCIACGGNSITNVSMTNLYMHGWTHPVIVGTAGAATCGTGCSDSLFLILCGSNGDPTTVIDRLVADGGDSTNGGDSGHIVKSCSNVTNSYLANAGNFILHVGSGTISGNTLYWLHGYNGTGGALGSGGESFDGTHENDIEDISPGSNYTVNIFNNVIHKGCGEASFMGNLGATTNYFNNVLYDLNDTSCTGNPIHVDARYGAWTGQITNNTIFANSGGNCIIEVGTTSTVTLTVENNHCISSVGLDDLTSPFVVTRTTNVTMTPTQATAAGYSDTQPFVGIYTSPNCDGQANCPIGAGTNAGVAGTWPSGFSTSDTGYGVTVDATHHVVTPARNPNARPPSAVWDAGAYQSPPQPASGLGAKSY